MHILFIGDMVGKGSRKAAREIVPQLRQEYGCSLVIANGENMAGGGGMTAKCLRGLAEARIDVFTGGDHMWDQRSLVEEIADFPNVLRPANVCPQQPGRGTGVFETLDHGNVGVICLQGRTFMNSSADCPFAAADRCVEELQAQTSVIIVDMHAEATSEKIAMGRYLDGRVTAVLGTHTHVATADEQILPAGTAYQTDVGMVGARESVLGRDIEPVLQKFSTGMPARFTVVEKGIRLHATLIHVDPQTGKALDITRIWRDFD
ncbi:MAG: YmdB family metallophosphoesterase [Kiritimatiellales bacterium]|nr:YmdB family metallophosphoesterase [Kiritimatiellales bacterium]